MFTGIIQAIGQIQDIVQRGGDARLTVNTGKISMNDIHLGDSIAVNGVCLTAVALGAQTFEADVSVETLDRTSIGALKVGSQVNLELALTPTTRLGGHLVSGHVDGLGKVVSRKKDARSERFAIAAPKPLMKYIAEKGSICVDGVSLTVNAVSGDTFELNIVPHTLLETILDQYKPGRKVNLEVDIIARYLERLILGGIASDLKTDSLPGISAALLTEHGFIKG